MYNDVMTDKDNSVHRLLFIGNSATYVNDIPGTLVRLARKAGRYLEADSIVKGGARLSFHADFSSEHGKRLLRTIEDGYDIVFLQDNGDCISEKDLRIKSQNACRALGEKITASGARIGIYFRPPYGYEKWGLDPFAQCRCYDDHFSHIWSPSVSVNVYVNRAFAYALKETGIKLWGEDHAHTSIYGAYLAVCVFFAALFNSSSKILDANGLPPEDACMLQEIADRVVLNREIPW